MDDPDVSSDIKVYDHWILFNIPSETRKLPAGIQDKDLPAGTKRGITTKGTLSYVGPCPKEGTHRYYFKLYALPTMLDLPEGSTHDQVYIALKKDYFLEMADLVGTYERVKF